MGGVTNSESFCGLTMIGRRTELQLMVQFHAITDKIYTYKLYFFAPLALTGVGGFDQCPAPFAGPSLQIAATTPDKPLFSNFRF